MKNRINILKRTCAVDTGLETFPVFFGIVDLGVILAPREA